MDGIYSKYDTKDSKGSSSSSGIVFGSGSSRKTEEILTPADSLIPVSLEYRSRYLKTKKPMKIPGHPGVYEGEYFFENFSFQAILFWSFFGFVEVTVLFQMFSGQNSLFLFFVLGFQVVIFLSLLFIRILTRRTEKIKIYPPSSLFAFRGRQKIRMIPRTQIDFITMSCTGFSFFFKNVRFYKICLILADGELFEIGEIFSENNYNEAKEQAVFLAGVFSRPFYDPPLQKTLYPKTGGVQFSELRTLPWYANEDFQFFFFFLLFCFSFFLGVGFWW